MASFTYTSTTNFVCKFLLLIVGIIVVAFTSALLEPSLNIICVGLHIKNTEGITALCALAMLLLFTSCLPEDADDYLDGVTSYYYANHVLGASIAWRDARRLNKLFSTGSGGVWFPLEKIKQLPVDKRRMAILATADQLLLLRKPIRKEALKSSASVKLSIATVFIVLYCVTTAHFAQNFVESGTEIFLLSVYPFFPHIFILAVAWAFAWRDANSLEAFVSQKKGSVTLY